MLEIRLDKQFKKDIKRDQKSDSYKDKDFKELKRIMDCLIEEKELDEKYLAHKLIGD